MSLARPAPRRGILRAGVRGASVPLERTDVPIFSGIEETEGENPIVSTGSLGWSSARPLLLGRDVRKLDIRF